MKTIIVSNAGINWNWYHTVKLTSSKAEIIKSWRAHKHEERGRRCRNVPSCTVISGGIDITRWKADGKPGGLQGAKNNYRDPSKYLTIQTGLYKGTYTI